MALLAGLINNFVIAGCTVTNPVFPFQGLMNGEGQQNTSAHRVLLPANLADQSLINGFMCFGDQVDSYFQTSRQGVLNAGLTPVDIGDVGFFYDDPNGISYYVYCSEANNTFSIYSLYNFAGNRLIEGFTDESGDFPLHYSPLIDEGVSFSDGLVLDSFNYIFDHPAMFCVNPSKQSSGWYRGEFLEKPACFPLALSGVPSVYFNLFRLGADFELRIESVGLLPARYNGGLHYYDGNSMLPSQEQDASGYSVLGSTVFLQPDGAIGKYIKPNHDYMGLPVATAFDWSNLGNETDIGGTWNVLSCDYTLHFYSVPTTGIVGGGMFLSLMSQSTVAFDTMFGDGYDAGYTDGYVQGVSDVGTSQGNVGGAFDLLRGAFNSLGNILAIEVLPDVSVALLVTLPVAGALILWIIRLLKGG